MEKARASSIFASRTDFFQLSLKTRTTTTPPPPGPPQEVFSAEICQHCSSMYGSSSSTQGCLLPHAHRLLPFFLLWLQIGHLNPSTALSTFDSIPARYLAVSPLQRLVRHSIVCEVTTKKPDSAVMRARQAEKRRIYNKSRKSEIKTRMKKVLEALDGLKKKPDAAPEQVLSIEKLIGEAYSIIDKAVKVGTLHRNTGAWRKSRLARRKKAVG